MNGRAISWQRTANYIKCTNMLTHFSRFHGTSPVPTGQFLGQVAVGQTGQDKVCRNFCCQLYAYSVNSTNWRVWQRKYMDVFSGAPLILSWGAAPNQKKGGVTNQTNNNSWIKLNGSFMFFNCIDGGECRISDFPPRRATDWMFYTYSTCSMAAFLLILLTWWHASCYPSNQMDESMHSSIGVQHCGIWKSNSLLDNPSRNFR